MQYALFAESREYAEEFGAYLEKEHMHPGMVAHGDMEHTSILKMAEASDVLFLRLRVCSNACVDALGAATEQHEVTVVVVADTCDQDTQKAAIEKGIPVVTPGRSLYRQAIDVAILELPLQQSLHTLEERLEKAERTLEEQKRIGRAKAMLMKKKAITEEQAHKLLQKLAMSERSSMGEISRMLILADDALRD